MISVRINGVEQNIKSLGIIARGLSSEARQRIGNEASMRGLGMIKGLTPGSGRIREQWKARRLPNYRWKIENEAARTEKGEIILRVLEGGSKPHIIRPRYKKALHFYIGDKEIFAKKVRHPGTKAYMMIRRTSKVLIKAIPVIGKKVINDLIRRAG